jgi:hypothetical protein
MEEGGAGHTEIPQGGSTENRQDFGDVKVKTRDPNEYVIELSPGWR